MGGFLDGRASLLRIPMTVLPIRYSTLQIPMHVNAHSNMIKLVTEKWWLVPKWEKEREENLGN